MKRWTLAALLLACSSPVLARDGTGADTAAPRVSGHLGMNLVVGPVSLDGDGHKDAIITGFPGPGFSLAFRFDWLFGETVLLGIEARGFTWTTMIEQELDYDMHHALDLSLEPGYRLAGIDDDQSELHVSFPIGIGFERFQARQGGPWAERVEQRPGFHLGALVGYQRRWHFSAWGHVFEAGLIYHHVQKRFVFTAGGADEVVYQPVELFFRAGLVVYCGS